jgi:alkanesulfonate monooxygenase SsuD/methylene tetrahydromethanopterin reductase-like flavin-dependent oxidoreductase (luciferase family)
MPYAYLDMAYQKSYPTDWVVLPNTYFDPVKGHELYNRYLDELELAAELGFDGLSVNEHHQNAYGLMPSPVVMAAALSRRTKTCKIAILGNAFCLREHPLTLAEEHAMLDVITGGRFISGMVRGIGAEYFSLGVNPAYSHERYHEAHDLVLRAWTEPGPFAFEGKHYHFEYVNIWPRPYQQPHPPIWIPSLGSAETIEWAVHPSRKYTYLQMFSSFESVVRYLTMYRTMAAQTHGYVASSQKIGWGAPVYVAETDEQAIAEARPHIEALFNKFLVLPFEFLAPPGYLSARSLKAWRANKRPSTSGGTTTIEGLIEAGVFICGSPDTVRRILVERHRKVGYQQFLGLLQFATLPRDLTERNIRLFAREVMPTLQALSDKDFAGVEAGELTLSG